MENHTNNEIDLIKAYENKGYDRIFKFENDKIVETKTKTAYVPEQIFIVAEHRFEGMSNPSDMSILYVIEAVGGYNGTILVAYGSNGNLELSEFFKKIPKSNISNEKNLVSN